MITLAAKKPGFTFATDTSTIAVYTKGDGITLGSTPADEPSTTAITWPGEYDFSGTAITGIHALEENKVLYVLHAEQIACGFLPDPLFDINDDILEKLGTVNVLILTAAQGKLVQKLLDEIDPQIVVVMMCDDAALNAETLKTLGAEGQERVTSYKIKNLPAEGREVVVFE